MHDQAPAKQMLGGPGAPRTSLHLNETINNSGGAKLW